jgi:hypothetical protein
LTLLIRRFFGLFGSQRVLNAVSNILAGNLGQHPVYLRTLPMFHSGVALHTSMSSSFRRERIVRERPSFVDAEGRALGLGN